MKVILFIRLNEFWAVIVFAILIQVLAITNVMAEVKGPGWFVGTADPVVPEKANIYYKLTAKILKTTRAKESFRTFSFSTKATEITDEIAELARALRNDPKLIYGYVHNHIDYIPYFGSLKGATLTILDGNGNDFDQVSLMIALLRESGYTAGFAYGTMSIPYDNLANWTGIGDEEGYGWESFRKIISSNGIPVELYGTYAKLDRVWVKATINGTDYLFDPAFKAYEYTTSQIDIAQATGYTESDFLAAATSGANVGSDYVQNLNEGSLANKLVEYSGNLINTIRNQSPNSKLEEILGGRSIIQSNLDQYQTSLPFNTENVVYWDEIPSEYIGTLRIQHEGIDHTFDIPEMAGKRLTITYSGSSFIPELRLNCELIVSGNSTTQGTRYNLTITIDHPYAANNGTYMDQASTYPMLSGATYAIVSDFGGTSDALLHNRKLQLSRYIADELGNASEEVRGETLNIMGLTWMKELLLAERIIAAIAGTVSVTHHRIGRMAQETGYYIDVKTSFSSTTSINDDDNDEKAGYVLSGLVGSNFEHGILEQMMGSGIPGISTLKIFQIANAEGHKVFLADSSNFASIKLQLQNYSQPTLDILQSDVDAGNTLILPDNGQLGIEQWQGLGYITKYFSPTSGAMGLIIAGGYYGGYSSIESEVNPITIQSIVQVNLPDTSQIIGNLNPISQEPVDLASGVYLYDSTDIALGGGAPLGLAFARSYNSSTSLTKNTLGYGWTHNNDIHLIPKSHGDPGLGRRQPVDAAAVITALYASFDLLKNQDDIQGWMVACLATKWAVDRLIDNSVTVELGTKVLEYIKLPDGTYSPPPGITTKLIDNGDNTFSLQERYGTHLDFDTNNSIANITDINGNSITFTYNGDKLFTVQDDFGHIITLQYTGEKLTSVSDSAGRFISYGYDADDNLTAYTDTEGKVWNYGYDSLHRMITLSNPLGITTANNTYDSLGRVNTQTVPRQGGITATYNFYFSGFRNVEEDPYGKDTIYHFDDKGRTVGIENSLGHKISKKFDGQNHEVEVTDPRGSITNLVYDGNHNLTDVINALNYTTTNAYDAQFRLTTTTDPLNHTMQFDFDSEHHLIKTTDAEGNENALTYYTNGQTNTRTDGRGTVTTLTYDGFGNPQTSTTGSHPPVTYTYDSIGKMTTLTNNEGAATAFEYDNRGVLLSSADPLGRIATNTYNDAGRLTTVTDRNNDTTTYSYTPSDKLETITYQDGSQVTFTYNLHDKLTAVQDAIGTTSYTYDDVYRLTTVTNAHNFIVSYEYNEVGNVTKTTYPDNKEVSYTFDELNRLQTVTNWLNQTATYTYDAAGRLTSLDNFNGTITTYGYDDADRLTALENRKSDSSVISTYNFTLDANGNRTRIIQDEPLLPVLSSGGTTFTYNQQKNRLETAGSSTFSYDNEGQISDKSGTAYTFDYAHRLASIGGTTAQFSYNGGGNRLQAVRDGVTTRYIYDAAGNLLAEADDSNTITRYYIHGLGLLAMITPTNQSYCYHFNAVGSTIAMTDQSQNIINQYAYTPFGIIANEQETVTQPFKYVGQYGVMTESNGFYYMRARYYDLQVGRFISQDPIGFAGGDVNLYGYVLNNPINFVDPSGLWTLGLDISVTTGVGAGGTTGFTIVLDGYGNLAILHHGGGGGVAGTAAGGAVQVQVTNADNVFQLEGIGVSSGGSLGSFATVNPDYLMGNGYQGVAIGAGLDTSPSPIETHSFVEQSNIWWSSGTSPKP